MQCLTVRHGTCFHTAFNAIKGFDQYSVTWSMEGQGTMTAGRQDPLSLDSTYTGKTLTD